MTSLQLFKITLTIDNKVLQARLDKLQKAYDVLAKKTPCMDHTPNACKCNNDNVKPDKVCNCKKTTVNVRPGSGQYIPINVSASTKHATLDDLESYVDKLYKDVFKRFVE